uniref:Uncharacterized protein n=1 Tax=viral metagenome TaxID=1070528 RepID=A0A6C0J9L9_9ZZZZ
MLKKQSTRINHNPEHKKTLKKYSVTILKIFFFIFHFLFQQ